MLTDTFLKTRVFLGDLKLFCPFLTALILSSHSVPSTLSPSAVVSKFYMDEGVKFSALVI